MFALVLAIGAVCVVVVSIAIAEAGQRRRFRQDLANSHLMEVVVLGAIVASGAVAVIQWSDRSGANATAETERAEGAVEDALAILDNQLFPTDAIAKLVTESVNGETRSLRSSFEQYLDNRGLQYRAFVKNGHDYYVLHDPTSEPQGPSVERSRLFVGDWSYAMAIAGLNITNGLAPLDIDAVLVGFGDHKKIQAASARFTVDTSAGSAHTWRPAAVTSRGSVSECASSVRLQASTELGQETGWTWAVDPQNPTTTPHVILRALGCIEPGTRVDLSPPPGWTLAWTTTPGWEADETGHGFRYIGGVDDPRLRLQVVVGGPRVTDTFQFLHARLSNGAVAEATYVLPFPGVDAGIDHDVLVNVPYPWRPAERNTVAMTYLNGGGASRLLNTVAVDAGPGIFDSAQDVRVRVMRPEEAPIEVVGRFDAAGRLRVNLTTDAILRAAGEAYTVPSPTNPLILKPMIASGATTILIDAVSAPQPDPRAAGALARMGATLGFGNGFTWNVTSYDLSPGVFHAEVPAASAPGATDGYPHPLSLLGTTSTEYDATVSSNHLARWMNGTFGYTVISNADAALSSRLLSYRNAYKQSTLGFSAEQVPLGSTVLVTSDFDALVLELTRAGATEIRHDLRVYSPPTLGVRPDTVVRSTEGAVNVLVPFEHGVLAELDGLAGGDVAWAAGDRLVGFRGGDGAILWRTEVADNVTGLAAWRASATDLRDSVAVAHRGVTLLDGGVARWSRPDLRATHVAAGAWGTGTRLAAAGEDTLWILDGAGAVVATASLQFAGTVRSIEWRGSSIVVSGDTRTYTVIVESSTLSVTLLTPQATGAGSGPGGVATASGLGVLVSTSEGTRRETCPLDSCAAWRIPHAGAAVARLSGTSPHGLILTPSGHLQVLDATTGAVRVSARVESPTIDLDPYSDEFRAGLATVGLCAQFDVTNPRDVLEALPFRNPEATVAGHDVDGNPCDAGYDRWLRETIKASRSYDVLPLSLVEVPRTGRSSVAVATYVAASDPLGLTGPVRLAIVDLASGEILGRAELGAEQGDLVTSLVATTDGFFLAQADGDVSRWTLASLLIPTPAATETYRTATLEHLGKYRNALTTPLNGWYGAHAVVSTLSWQDPLLHHRAEARLLGVFEVVQPDGTKGGPTYTFTVEGWWPESAFDPRFCGDDDRDATGALPWFCPEEDGEG